MTSFITFIISLLLLNAVLPAKMIPLDIALTIGLVAFTAATTPKKPKPKPPTIPDVWKTIQSAQHTLNQGYALIYGGTSE